MLSRNDLAPVAEAFRILLAQGREQRIVLTRDWPTLPAYADVRQALRAVGADLDLDALLVAAAGASPILATDLDDTALRLACSRPAVTARPTNLSA